MDSKIKEIVSTEYNKIYENDSDMFDYSIKCVSNAIILESGFVYIFEKRSILKDFCFGYTLSSNESISYDNAVNMARTVRNDNGEFFKEKNLEWFDTMIEDLKSGKDFYAVAVYYKNKNSLICNIFDSDTKNSFFNSYNSAKLTENDINNIIIVLNEEKKKFEKRLNTYLKRYGTSKINSWTYWIDA